MSTFTEEFNDLTAWDFGTGPAEGVYFSAAETISPVPYSGAFRAGHLQDGNDPNAAARFDVADGGNPATMYWIAYAFYFPTWAEVEAAQGSNWIYLPGFITRNDDPIKGFFITDDVAWIMPQILASSSSAGVIQAPAAAFIGTANGDAALVGENQWHTLRLGVQFDGAASHTTMYLDGALVYDEDEDWSSAGFADAGLHGIVVAAYGLADNPGMTLAFDAATYSSVADPGEPDQSPALSCTGTGVEVEVYIDDVEVTGFCIAGSWTPRLNRPAQAQVTTPMDAAIVGDCGSLLKIVKIDGVSEVIVFHGRILNVEVDTGKDEGTVVWNAQDAMELWQWRTVRDPDADFSKPDIISTFQTGPQILEAALENSIDTTAGGGGPPPGTAEGPLELNLGSFEIGGADVSGAPTDWPMTIMELFSLLVSTGQLDAIITYTDDTGDTTGTIDGYNGDYGDDLSGDVLFQYGTGLFNIASLRWNRDMTNVVNKYHLFAGPRIATAGDPAGEQHWCFNVTGPAPNLPYPPGGDLSPPASSTNNPLGVRRADSQDLYGVRQRIDIFDNYDDDCVPGVGNPGRNLARRQWQTYSWLAAFPREIVHITPTPDTLIGCFHIGDLVHVEAVADVRGGLVGVQRVYEYTVSWEGTPSLLTLSEIQTSADNEGQGG